VWAVFEGRVLEPTLLGMAQRSYAELVSRWGFASPAQASNVLMTATRMFARIIRFVIGRYAKTQDEIEAEVRDLLRVLTAPDGAG
jgi:hypothetical protein